MECTVNWLPASGMGFVAETGSGHVLVMDGAPDGGGRNLHHAHGNRARRTAAAPL